MIGVFDSGVGGLTVLQALRKRLPRTDFIYLADTARLPYGSREPEEIRGFATENAAFLYSLGIEGIVIACNTASAIALAEVRLACPVPVWGMVDAGVEAVTRATCTGRVAVLATQATIASGVFQRRLESRGLRVWAQACPALVQTAEHGARDAEAQVRRYVSGMPHVDTILLGCTHFALLRSVIEKVAGPRVRVVDGAETVAAKVAAQVEDEGYASVRYYSSGVVGVSANHFQQLSPELIQQRALGASRPEYRGRPDLGSPRVRRQCTHFALLRSVIEKVAGSRSGRSGDCGREGRGAG